MMLLVEEVEEEEEEEEEDEEEEEEEEQLQAPAPQRSCKKLPSGPGLIAERLRTLILLVSSS